MKCGEKISDLRKKHGMTQDDLGKAMNVSYQAVSKWERDESMPDFDTMSKIAKFFNVPLGYFEEDGELPHEESKETAASDTVIGVCTACGKMLKAGEEARTSPKIVCKECDARQRQAAQHAAEQQRRQMQQMRAAEAQEVVGHGFDATLIVSLVLAVVGYIIFAVIAFGNLESDDVTAYAGSLFIFPIILFALTHSIMGSINELRDKDDDANYSLVLSLIIGACFAVVHTGLFLGLYLSAEGGEASVLLALLIVGAILSFTFVSQFLWGSAIKEVFTAGGFTFKLPGFIITLSIDSLIWMIVVKFFLGILAAFVFIVTTLIVALVAIFGSAFFFIPCLLLKLGRDHKARQSMNA